MGLRVLERCGGGMGMSDGTGSFPRWWTIYATLNIRFMFFGPGMNLIFTSMIYFPVAAETSSRIRDEEVGILEMRS